MTRCLIPEFILRKAYKKEYCGSFEAWVMHVDLLDFSSLCTRLMSDSDRGAEHLSEVINAVFDPATRAMEHYGGFIDRFAGDAFVAIFPIANPDSWFRALCAACQMRDIVLRQSPISISSRIGMAKRQGQLENPAQPLKVSVLVQRCLHPGSHRSSGISAAKSDLAQSQTSERQSIEPAETRADQ